MENNPLNVFGLPLISCCQDPVTGYFRDGYCKTIAEDRGTHVVCARVTREFLDFSRSRGNDLITPIPEWQFPGLKPGDQWCLCVSRWIEAEQAGVAPPVILEATHEKALEYTNMENLLKYAYKAPV
ncbi:DUF2237 family protein [Muriicola marianensis]|uniref:DUF2237 domain-containing protein n=1 Tax=Muriicola marianensis TaxID=1324801 RepID=A0ABQ1R075_9FLAO|nr:DUF2237 domain-containing protein [Muriicola marianensis]GGD51811.1 hypothetical protein GCM10011361_18150 [Muriicola marianensis]